MLKFVIRSFFLNTDILSPYKRKSKRAQQPIAELKI
jgi:hypothetical protein